MSSELRGPTTKTLSIDLDSHIVEAHVSLTVGRLNEILRLVIDQSNAHEQTIADLKAHLSQVTLQNSLLQEELLRLKPDGDRMTWLCNSVDQLTIGLERLRAEASQSIDSVNSKLDKKIESLEVALRNEEEQRQRQSTMIDQKATNASVQADDCKFRLDKLKIPDIAPIKTILNEHKAHLSSLGSSVAALERFTAMWSFNDDGAQAALALPEGSQKSADAKVSAIHETPPIQALQRMFKASLGEVETGANSKHRELTAVVGTKADKVVLNAIASELASDMKTVQANSDFVNRRMDSIDALPKTIERLEQNLALFSKSKADASQLSLKADDSALQSMSGRVTELRDDINDLYDRLSRNGAKGVAPSQSRRGSTPTNMQKQNSVALQNALQTEELKKKVGEVQGEFHRLLKGKADREELLRLHDYVDGLELKTRRTAADVVRQHYAGEAAVISGSTSLQQQGKVDKDGVEHIRPPHRPASGDSSPGSRPGTGRRAAGGTVDFPALRPSSGKRESSGADAADTAVFLPVVTSIQAPRLSASGDRQKSPPKAYHGSVCVRGCDGVSTPASISNMHSVPIVLQSP